MIRSPLLIVAALILSARPTRAESPPAGLAERAWAVTDAVMARHVDPPARQQMILAGLKATLEAAGVEPPADLARRASAVTTARQFADLLAATWPGNDPASKPRPAAGRPRGAGMTGFLPSAEATTPADALIDGMLSVVSGGAELASAKDLKVEEQVAGNLYVGIQVALAYDAESRRASIGEAFPGGPADRAGVKAGDSIEAVEGVAVVGLPFRAIVERLRGELGTEVEVRLRRPNVAEAINARITRGVMPRETVEGVRLGGPDPIAHLKIKEIAGSTPRELQDWARRAESEGGKAILLDLRELKGSDFHAALLLADALLDGGTIGRVRSLESTRTYRAGPDALFLGWPMAVLARDGLPGEAAWLVAALRDNGRATVFGGGAARSDEVRSAVALPGGDWAVKMATGRLERGDGRPLLDQAGPEAQAALASRPAGALGYDFANAIGRPVPPQADLLAEARAALVKRLAKDPGT